MKICRFNDNRIGVVSEDQVADVTGILQSLGVRSYPFPNHDLFIANLPRLLPQLKTLASTAHRVPLSSGRRNTA